MLLEARERVVKDGDHEPLLGFLPARRAETLRGEDGAGLRRADEYSGSIGGRFHHHPALIEKGRRCP
jgi:hypothetical protein